MHRPAPPVPHPRDSLLRTDVRKALRLLHRSASVREFMLDTAHTDTDVALLTAPRPAFTITTEEEQVGALPGRIALRYLGVPAFCDRAGFSGGAVVTSYLARTHPLHAPAVMADVRLGRYIRDNKTGEWCIITRNMRDRLTRLQYVSVTGAVSRERICLTCSSDLFDAGHFLASVLFQCHDHEWRPCPHCGRPPAARCACSAARLPPPPGLAGAAATVLREGPASWVGKVRVTVCSNLSRNALLDIDECMDVRSSYQPAMDTALAADMKRLAIYEKVTSSTCIPAPLRDPPALSPDSHLPPIPDISEMPDDVMEELNCVDNSSSSNNSSSNNNSESLSVNSSDSFTNPSDDIFGNAFAAGDVDFGDTFLASARYEFPNCLESAILPADPSTLPGGTELCMDGMDIEEDWCSFVTHEREAASAASAASASSAAVPVRIAVQPETSAQEHLPVRKPQPPMSMRPHRPPMSMRPHRPPMSMQPPRPPPPPKPPRPPQPPRQQKLPSQPPFPLPAVFPKEEDQLHVEPAETKPQQPALRGRPLAPRPAGMSACTDGFIWQMGATTSGNAYAMAARLEAMEKERKAEERRKKNRQAAARSNARKKCLMDGIKADIKEAQTRAAELRKRELDLRAENRELKRKAAGMSN